MKKQTIIRFIIALIICQGLGIIGALFTSDPVTGSQGWYAFIDKPSFTPPPFVFAPVWIILYTTLAIVLTRVWNKGFKKKEVRDFMLLFIPHLILNGLWSILFFGINKPLLALIDILLMVGTSAFILLKLQKIDKPSAYILTPYHFWITFATALNYSIVLLN